MEMDLETVGYLSGELSGFFAHVANALSQKSSTGSLPPSLFNGSTTIAPVAPKPGRKSKKVKSTRAPRAVSAYNQFVKEKLAEMHNTHNGDESGQSHKARFEEVTKMWSGMNEEEKRAYTEDFKARVARGEISALSARVTAEAAAAAAAVPDAVVSPPEDDAAAPSPKKKKKRKNAGEAIDDAFASPLGGADAGAAFQGAADAATLGDPIQGEKKKKKKKKKHLEAAAAAAAAAEP